MKCPKCHFDNPDDTRFCGNCAAPLIPSKEIPLSKTKTYRVPLKELTTGSTFAGRYQVIEELGKGGMGKVYKVLDKKIEEEVALKLLKPEIAADEDTIKRFRNELKFARKISHRNVCRMYDLNEEEGTHFITMEYVSGEDLKSTIRKVRQLSVGQTITIARQVCEGLAEAHRLGVVHRDLKPQNIMIDREGNARIMDFGIARSLEAKGITEAGMMIGTPQYMSPEQVEGKKADGRSDIYSLGVILYEMATGRVPFEGDTPLSIAVKHKTEPPPDPREVNAQIPEDLSRLILRCLEKDKEKRYREAEEVLSELSNIERGIPTIEKLLPKRKALTYIAITSLVVLLIVAAIFIWQRTETRRIESLVARLQPAVEAGRFDEVFEILNYSGLELQDVRVKMITEQVIGKLSIKSTPSKARVTLARVRSEPTLSVGEPMSIGHTPSEGRALVAGEYFVYMGLEGMIPLEFLIQVVPGESLRLSRTLIKANKEFAGMVRIEKGVSQNGISIAAFYINKHEVTNAEFFNFVAAGGYRVKKFWPEDIIINGHSTPWESALRSFVDQTGIPGPRFWSGGKYPDGKEDHPVVGISWYEAMAYARWAGKDLPTWNQWWLAALGETGSVFPWGGDVKNTLLRANFGLKGTQPVGSFPLGVSPFGCYDMAGNVREWLQDSVSSGIIRTVVGGSWKSPSYMFEASHAESFYSEFYSDEIGFRCVKSIFNNQ